MLEGLRLIDWSRVTDAYGPATEVPKLIAAIAAGKKAALRDLGNRIAHQGAITPAAAPATPFIVELAVARCEPFAALLVLVGDLACAGNHHNYTRRAPTKDDPGVPEATLEALRVIVPTALAALSDGDPKVRAAAAIPLAFLGDEAVYDQLAMAIVGEAKAPVTATWLLALATLGQRLGRVELAPFEAHLGGAAAVKLAAHTGRVLLAPTVEHAKAALAVAVKAKDRLAGVPWAEGEVREIAVRQCAEVLAQAGELTSLYPLEDALGVEQVLRLIVTAVLGHDDWHPRTEPYVAEDLSPAQRDALVDAYHFATKARPATTWKPSFTLSPYGLFALDRLLGLAPAGARDRRTSAGEPLWRLAWRAMRAGESGPEWRDAVAGLDEDDRVDLALDLLDLREGASFPPDVRRGHSDGLRYDEGRDRVVAVVLDGVPAARLETLLGHGKDLRWTARALGWAWVRALKEAGLEAPAAQHKHLAELADDVHAPAEVVRDFVMAVPESKRDKVFGAIEPNLYVDEDELHWPRKPSVILFRAGWHLVDLVPSIYAAALTEVATWDEPDGPSEVDMPTLGPIIEAEVIARLSAAPASFRKRGPKTADGASGQRIFAALGR